MRNFANIFWYVKLFWKQIDFYYSLIARTSADSRCFVSGEQLSPHTIDSSAEIFKYFYYFECSWHEIETSINLASSPRHQTELPAQILSQDWNDDRKVLPLFPPAFHLALCCINCMWIFRFNWILAQVDTQWN